MHSEVCIRCGARLDIADNQSTLAERENKAFADNYCKRCLNNRPQAEPIVEKPAVFEALKRFINARPDLDPANYGCRIEQLRYSTREQRISARSAMVGDLRSIQRDGTRARKALAEAQRYPFNPEAMADAFKRAFSGRLSWDGHKLTYCAGQYYPTEYRAAAATVLEYYVHAVKPKFTPAPGQRFDSIHDIEIASRNVGSHWFDADTKRFFRSRVMAEVFQGAGGIYFVSSEKGPNGVRRFTVRKFNPVDADISTFGPFNELTREKALRVARIAAEYPDAALESVGYKLDERGYQVQL